jgi:hypothetical protein
MAGDRILALDGKAVQDAHALADAIRARKPGSKVKLTILRDETQKVIPVKLGARVPGEPWRAKPPRPKDWWPKIKPYLPRPVLPRGPMHLKEDDVHVWIWGLPPEARKQLAGKIRQWVRQYKKDHPAPAYLGVGIGPAKGGLRVLSVDLTSPAGKAGIQAGDLLVKLDGKPVGKADEFVKAIRARKAGEQVRVEVHRDVHGGKGRIRMELLITLGKRPARPWMEQWPRHWPPQLSRPKPWTPDWHWPPRMPGEPKPREGRKSFKLPRGGEGTLRWRVLPPDDEKTWKQYREQIEKLLKQFGGEGDEAHGELQEQLEQIRTQMQEQLEALRKQLEKQPSAPEPSSQSEV